MCNLEEEEMKIEITYADYYFFRYQIDCITLKKYSWNTNQWVVLKKVNSLPIFDKI